MRYFIQNLNEYKYSDNSLELLFDYLRRKFVDWMPDEILNEIRASDNFKKFNCEPYQYIPMIYSYKWNPDVKGINYENSYYTDFVWGISNKNNNTNFGLYFIKEYRKEPATKLFFTDKLYYFPWLSDAVSCLTKRKQRVLNGSNVLKANEFSLHFTEYECRSLLD